MNLPSPVAITEPSSARPWEQLDRIEQRICNDFRHRVHNFRIQAFDDGLVLEGRTKTFHGKQAVLHAIMAATELPILADRIVVG